jgi:hypothetical protein
VRAVRARLRASSLLAAIAAVASATVLAHSSASALGSLDTWAPAGALATPRLVAAVVPLPDGSVLAAGGNNYDISSMRSTERFDPRSRSWQAAAPMVYSRAGHSAVVLKDGRVLVMGGHGYQGMETGCGPGGCFYGEVLASAEVYDPKSGTWSQTGSMVTPRFDFASVLLGDGRVLVSGGYGYGPGPVPYTRAEVYDAATGRFTAVADMPGSRFNHQAVLLQDGRVLLVGGDAYASTPLSSAVIYDPVHDTWTTAAPMDRARDFLTATPLLDGRVLVVGGDAEVYDPRLNLWMITAPMHHPRVRQGAVRLMDGRVLVAGGMQATSTDLERTSDVFDPATGLWSSVVPMLYGRFDGAIGTAALLVGREVLVTGGFGDVGVSSTTETYALGGLTPAPVNRGLSLTRRLLH